MHSSILAIVLFPLLGALINGLLGWRLSKRIAHVIAILGVGVSCVLSIQLTYLYFTSDYNALNFDLFKWAVIGEIEFKIGFLFDSLSALMCSIVTFVSLMVHIYTIGYMKDDKGYQRFFSYISLFTFAMLMLVLSNNFLQLFFGWEAVGLVSYLLIGFWFKKDSAVFANLKAFLVNRVGDFGFLIGIAGVFYYFNSLDYQTVFEQLDAFETSAPAISIGLGDWSAITFICICLFIGAMGKSAQVPLHVWLPDSMEGPTPISALIHAATMVTAGVFMVARMSPLFELSETALSFVLIIGATTAISMGILGIIQNDIKRVVAYSTLSQLGYMVAGLGASAYAASIFHLMTHAFFKALLFLAAGSVIVGMHHIQDIRQMGNLKKYMPITWITSLIGTLALVGFPFFSGFYSKDAIIEAVHASSLLGQEYAYYCLLIGVFFTALYSFRMYFLVFHTTERMDDKTRAHLQESPKVIWVPLVILAIPSVILSWWVMEPMLFGSLLSDSITVKPEHNSLAMLSREFVSIVSFSLHGFTTLPFLLLVIGFSLAVLIYVMKIPVNQMIASRLGVFKEVLNKHYYFDDFNQKVIVRGALGVAQSLWHIGDRMIIDGLFINGSAKLINSISLGIRKVQSGYLYHYALLMLIGVLAGFIWLSWPSNFN
ncbi:NADH-quinone oxidoreductase subunit L [Pleionea litopenaei]|uniref:NADH-quinone oxidoreductase subunit L n=1 Tax=Pleionea litopenaei TaxID=3070815 RepID=A0AA51RS20_9GAMM|nr:NADH-quinone oxidoreductase subunit L [Pleionea sp. HL-JVS1]WMS86522.1 NADH-quinone oxidoreductase subunit L [Pleionea sp. HL-JVS1]